MGGGCTRRRHSSSGSVGKWLQGVNRAGSWKHLRRSHDSSPWSLISEILSIDLRISATRFNVSAPETSCLKRKPRGDRWFILTQSLRGRSRSPGTSLVSQWLGLHAFTAGGTGLSSGWRAKNLKAAWCILTPPPPTKYTPHKPPNKKKQKTQSVKAKEVSSKSCSLLNVRFTLQTLCVQLKSDGRHCLRLWLDTTACRAQPRETEDAGQGCLPGALFKFTCFYKRDSTISCFTPNPGRRLAGD